jgi:hypothetical protein
MELMETAQMASAAMVVISPQFRTQTTINSRMQLSSQVAAVAPVLAPQVVGTEETPVEQRRLTAGPTATMVVVVPGR